MPKRPNLIDLTTQYGTQATINNNWDAVQEAFDNTLSRDGSTPNQMEASLDMNSNSIVNASVIYSSDFIIGSTSLVNAFAQASQDAQTAEEAAESAEDSAAQAKQYEGIWFDDAYALRDDTSLTYSNASVGDFVRTRKEGFSYQIKPSNSTEEYFVTNDAGLILEPLPDESGFVHIQQYFAVADGDRINGTGTDNSPMIRKAFKSDHNINLGVGTYAVEEPIFNLKEFRHVKGSGCGSVTGTPSSRDQFEPITSILAIGTPTKRVITRRKTRTTSSDPNDPPLGAVLENWGGGAQFYDFSIEIYCDYTDNSPTNFGADWDIGFYNGCRGKVATSRISINGYANLASFYWDVTDDFGIPQLLDPEGNPIPKANDGSDDQWTVRSSGADWCLMYRCDCIGGSHGVALLGADRNINPGGDYYDFVTDDIYSDGRGKSGASDFRIDNCQIRSVQHHSGVRRFDPVAMNYTAMRDTGDDETGSALFIDGWAENGPNDGPPGLRGITITGGRVESWEPFRIRLGQCKDVFFVDRVWNEAGASGLYNLKETDGTTDVNPFDYENATYGHFATTEDTSWVVYDYSTPGIFQNWVYDWTKTRITDRQGRVRAPDKGFIELGDDEGGEIPCYDIRPGGFISIMFSGIGAQAPISGRSAKLWFDVSDTPRLEEAGFLGAEVDIVAADTTLTTSNVTDGSIGVSANSDGTIKVFNRFGGERRIAWNIE